MSDPNRPSDDNPPQSPYGTPPSQPGGQPPGGQYPQQEPAHEGAQYPGQYPGAGYGGSGYDGPVPRPGSVTAAAWITIVLSALTGLFWVLVALILGFSKDTILEQLRDNREEANLTLSQINDLEEGIGPFVVVCVVVAAICFVTVLFAVLSLRRANWARILVVILSAITIVLGLLMVASGISLIWVVAGIAVIVLYFVGGANQYYSQRR